MSDVTFEQRGAIGLITLNRPQALNALTHAMCKAIHPQLTSWAADEAITAVVIQGAGDKAFCAGGDVVGLHTAGKVGAADWEQFFYDEYRLNNAISTFPKPYIALLDGITMGGGVGLSMHGPYRVASERFLFAMPETGIGLIPDVGGTHILAHLPGQIGLYLGLTGARLKAADAVALGLCTHFTPSDQIPALLDALIAQPQDVASVLARFNQSAGEAPLLAQQAMIDTHFGSGTVEAIMTSLCLGGDWEIGVRDSLLKLSPTSMKLSHRAILEGKGQSLAACLAREYRIVCQIKFGTDFFEGVRAALIDKDRKPVWKPAALGDVTEALLAPYFEAPAGGDLRLG
jgi:enoyl-CoA hydratase